MQEQGRGLSNEHAQHLPALCLILISILLSCPGMLEFPSFLNEKETKNFFSLKERMEGSPLSLGSDQILLKTMQVLSLNSAGFFEVYGKSHMLDVIRGINGVKEQIKTTNQTPQLHGLKTCL